MLENLGQVLPIGAHKYGDKTAFVIGSRSFSFNDLNHLSDRLASGLHGMGIAAGDRVTLYAQNCWEWIVSYYAIARLGAVVNPINVMLTPEEVAYVVKDCGARAILVPLAKARPLLDLKKHTPLQDIIVFGDDVPAGTRSFNALLEESAPECNDVHSGPEDLSTIGYTSGTTGYPKGAMLSHRAVLLNSAMFANMHVRTQTDITVTALPCAHVYGNIIMNGAFLTGMTLVLLERTRTPLEGRQVVVISRSNVVGKPLALMLLQKHATVMICHSRTTHLATVTRQADVLIAAAGRPGMVTAEMVKPGAIVIDVGMNMLSDGSIVGDIDFVSVREVAGAITPVPGGIGPLTNVVLLKQCVQAAWQLAGEKKEVKTAA